MSTPHSLAYLQQHRSHDAQELIRCWRRAVKGTPFRLRILGSKDGYPLVQISNAQTRGRSFNKPGLYISAGIHGDEPAPPWGLLDWFERRGYERLGERPVLLFPCLNPLGLVENQRVDGEGRDLNRLFDQSMLSPIREVRQSIAQQQFQLALCLHEDYDAQGAYVYDLNRTGDDSSARTLLHQARTRHIPIDERKRIDGRKADRGVLFRRRLDRRSIPGLPEAVFLFLDGYANRTLTFETPSEFSLHSRIEVHRRFLDAVCTWCSKR